MQNWQKKTTHRRYQNADGSFAYVIMVGGEEVAVTEEVYKVYAQAERKELYWVERDAGRTLSLEKLVDDSVLLEYLTDEHIESAEDFAIRSIMGEVALAAFMALDDDEQGLIQALVIDGTSERDYAAVIGLSQKGVNKRKHRILEKLKKAVLNG